MKDPPGPPMTLGDMRELGVQNLIALCLNDACRHQGLIDVSKYPDDVDRPDRACWRKTSRRRMDRDCSIVLAERAAFGARTKTLIEINGTPDDRNSRLRELASILINDQCFLVG